MGAGIATTPNKPAVNSPDYGFLNAVHFYDKGDLRVRVKFNNITDKRHYVGPYSNLFILPSTLLNMTVSMRWKF